MSAGLAHGQVTFLPVSLGFPQIAVGGDASGINYGTLVQMLNNNSAPTTAHIALFADSGSPLSVLVNGDGPKSTLDITLAGGETRQIQLTLVGNVTAGWMEIDYTPSEAVTSVIIQFRSGTQLLSEVGVDPAFDTFTGTDFSAETDSAMNTGIALANPSTSTVYILASLWDPASGAQITGTIITLPPNGHVARFLTELFPNVANIAQLRAEIALDSCLGATCNFVGTDGFLATAIRLNGDQFTTIPLVERAATGALTRIFPQVAFGGPSGGLNMKTVLYFTTNVATGVFGTAQIFDNDGNPLQASADGGAPSSTITITVSRHRVTRVVLSGDETLRSGWIKLTMSAEAHLVTSAIFQTFNGASLASEASVLEAASVKRGLIYVKTSAGSSNIGVAFVNSESTSNTISLDLYNRSGDFLGTTDITLQPNGHIARFVTELFPSLASLADFDGALSMRSSTNFSALALRLSLDKIATLPVALDGMFRPSITSVRITSVQRTSGQVNFEVDVTDFNSDIATSSSTTVNAVAYVNFGSLGFDPNVLSLDGTNVVGRLTGTLKGTFQSHVTGIPSGYSTALLVIVYDAAENQSNVIGLPFRF